jgi:hypothetical protein
MRKAKRKTKVRCGHCRKVATWRILWADGRAYWATCNTHKALGLRTIRANKEWAEIVSVTRVPR